MINGKMNADIRLNLDEGIEFHHELDILLTNFVKSIPFDSPLKLQETFPSLFKVTAQTKYFESIKKHLQEIGLEKNDN